MNISTDPGDACTSVLISTAPGEASAASMENFSFMATYNTVQGGGTLGLRNEKKTHTVLCSTMQFHAVRRSTFPCWLCSHHTLLYLSLLVLLRDCGVFQAGPPLLAAAPAHCGEEQSVQEVEASLGVAYKLVAQLSLPHQRLHQTPQGHTTSEWGREA